MVRGRARPAVPKGGVPANHRERPDLQEGSKGRGSEAPPPANARVTGHGVTPPSPAVLSFRVRTAALLSLDEARRDPPRSRPRSRPDRGTPLPAPPAPGRPAAGPFPGGGSTPPEASASSGAAALPPSPRRGEAEEPGQPAPGSGIRTPDAPRDGPSSLQGAAQGDGRGSGAGEAQPLARRHWGAFAGVRPVQPQRGFS